MNNIKITKRQFIAKISKKGKCKYREAAEIYKLFLDTLTEEILAGNQVILNGFGVFELKPHRGHEVRFSEKTNCDEYYVLGFRASKSLKAAINKRRSDG